jgi:methylase of polypeptide subunit release factors
MTPTSAPDISASRRDAPKAFPRPSAEGLAMCIASLRASVPSGREPWGAPEDQWSYIRTSGTSAALAELLHRGRAVPARLVARPVTGALAARGLLAVDGDRLVPRQWEVTAHRGVLAARDRTTGPGGATVYVGEDGLTFLDAVLSAAPRGDLIEIGSGSGIISAGAARTARQVTAVDILPDCLDATRLTAWLNGVDDRVIVASADLMADAFARRFGARYDCVVANLPGVPVPLGIVYSPAGDGGPDGSRLIRRLLRTAPRLLRPGRGDSESSAPALILRFQSLGTDVSCLLLDEIRVWALRHGFDALVTYTSRTPVDVRNGLTARYASAYNPAIPVRSLLAACDAHTSQLGVTQYYGATLVARPGAGDVEVVDLAHPPLLDVPLNVSIAAGAPLSLLLESRFLPCLAHLPEGYWEMGTIRHVHRVLANAPTLLGLLAAGCTARQGVYRLHSDAFDADPTASRSLLSVTLLLLDVLVKSRLVHRAPVSGVPAIEGEQCNSTR